MKPIMKYEYFDVYLYIEKPKTNIYILVSRHGDTLGEIRWWGSWRQYCFFPAEETVFSRGCLKDIQDFIESEMEKRK